MNPAPLRGHAGPMVRQTPMRFDDETEEMVAMFTWRPPGGKRPSP